MNLFYLLISFNWLFSHRSLLSESTMKLDASCSWLTTSLFVQEFCITEFYWRVAFVPSNAHLQIRDTCACFWYISIVVANRRIVSRHLAAWHAYCVYDDITANKRVADTSRNVNPLESRVSWMTRRHSIPDRLVQVFSTRSGATSSYLTTSKDGKLAYDKNKRVLACNRVWASSRSKITWWKFN